MGTIVKFGEWEFDPDSGDLSKGDKIDRLEPTVSRLLEYLLTNQGRVISREELTEKVWFNRIVSTDPINRCISIVRQTLCPDDKSAFIETVPKKGYIATFPPPPAIDTSADATTQQNRVKASKTLLRPQLIIGTLLCLVIFVLTYQWVDLAPPEKSVPSIAVMPFNDLSQDKINRHLAEGMSDMVIHQLSRIDNLNVTARTSSFAIASQGLTVRQIADSLSINHLLEGSIQVNGNKIRVLTRLIDTQTEQEIWSDSFDRNLQDLFPVQDDIAASVVSALKGTVLPHNHQTYEPEYEAFELVLKGQLERNKMTTNGFDKAAEYFRLAIEKDEAYPLPYILLAKTLKTQFDTDSYTHSYPSAEKRRFLEEAKALLEVALDLNPTSGDARSLKGKMLLADGKIAQAGVELAKAIEFEPNNAEAIGEYAAWLQKQNRLDEAVLRARRAVSLDPKSSRLQQILAQNLWISGRSEEALSVIELNAKNHPTVANNYALLGRWSLQLGKPGKAMLYAMRESELDPNNPDRMWGVCLMHYQLWDIEAGNLCANELLQDFPKYYEARKWLFDFEEPSDLIAGLAFIEQQIASFPSAPYYRLQASEWYLLTEQPEKVIAVLEPVFPELFNDKPVIGDWSLWAVSMIARAWQATSQDDKANTILNAGLAHIEKTRKLQGGGFSSGIDDVIFLVLLGQYDNALTNLKSAIDSRWSMYSMNFDQHPVFKPIKNDPRFLSLVEKHREFMAQEREWVEQHLNSSVTKTLQTSP